MSEINNHNGYNEEQIQVLEGLEAVRKGRVYISVALFERTSSSGI